MAVIQLKEVAKIYTEKNGEEIRAVDGVDLVVDKGDIFGIVGYSGAGKSTLVRLLNGLESPTKGSVMVNGERITDMNRSELRIFRKKIGMIFQHFNLLWSRTVMENIELPLEISGVKKAERRKRAQELLELVGLVGRGDHYPSQLSGGQKQRVGTTDEVLDLLLEINQRLGLTIVLITHEMHVIRKVCNKVAVMEQGKIVEEGKTLDIFRHPHQEITKRFVQREVLSEEDKEVLFQELIDENPHGVILSLHFSGDNANEPIISRVVRQFKVDVNIIHGSVQQAKEGAFGNLFVMILGEPAEIKKATAYIKTEGVDSEVIYGG
jgi:D-methionine transport system ATP-binding protein